MVLSPIITHEQHHFSFRVDLDLPCKQRGGDTRDLMDKCSP